MMEVFRDGASLALTRRYARPVRIDSISPPPRSRPVHPTQLYSAIDAGLLSWLLWAFFPFRTRDGQCIALMLTIHPITRFLLEVVRTDEPAVFGTGLSISQNISVLLLVCAAGIWWYISRRPRGIVWPLATPPAPQDLKHKTADRSAPAQSIRSAAKAGSNPAKSGGNSRSR
jgi:phosphatidylglycerol:prolipoprotein diacylglycerol transferase